jgi:hypothetical protein
MVAGYWKTFDWRYQETNSETTSAGTIQDMIAASEFISEGRIEANTLTYHLDVGASPQRLGGIITSVIEQGDINGNAWQGGVYADRKFIYEQAPTTPKYFLEGGQLLDASRNPVIPSLLLPGFLLRVLDAVPITQPPGSSNVWDDPQVAYVSEVEFIAPDGLKLTLPGQEPLLLDYAAMPHPGFQLDPWRGPSLDDGYIEPRIPGPSDSTGLPDIGVLPGIQ